MRAWLWFELVEEYGFGWSWRWLLPAPLPRPPDDEPGEYTDAEPPEKIAGRRPPPQELRPDPAVYSTPEKAIEAGRKLLAEWSGLRLEDVRADGEFLTVESCTPVVRWRERFRVRGSRRLRKRLDED